LRDKDGTEHVIFTGKQLRQATLKAANRGKGTKSKPEIIYLRERRTKKIHVFKAWKKLLKLPKIDLAGCRRKSANPLLRNRK
jgi:hypothetical protein